MSFTLWNIGKDRRSVGILALLCISGLGLNACKSDTALNSTAVGSGGSGSNGNTNGNNGNSTNPIGTLPSLPAGYNYNSLFMLAGPPPTSANPNPPTFRGVLHAQASVVGSGAAALNADWSQPCQISAGSANTDLVCIYEVEEADLYYAGTSCYRGPGGSIVSGYSQCANTDQGGNGGGDDRVWLSYNLPSPQNCPYFVFEPYYYWQFEPGVGPSVVNETNNLGAISFADPKHDGVNATIDPASGLCVDQFTGESINNTNNNGPNCCIGSYTLNVTTTTSSTTGGVTTFTTTSTSSQQSYGGNLASCINGPAANDSIWPHRSTATGDFSGFPEGSIIDTSLTPVSKFPITTTFAFGGGNSVDLSANVYSANYFDPPLGTTAANYFANYGNPVNMPVALSGKSPGRFNTNSQWYQAYCMDHSGDILSRIRLMIRPWSADSQFSVGIADAVNWNQDGLAPPTSAPFTQNLNFPAWGPVEKFYPYPGVLNWLADFPFSSD